jgi:protein CpxP
MKKLLLVFVMGFGLTAFAQNSTQQPGNSQSQMHMTPQQQQKHMDKMTKELSLTTQQQQQVNDLMTERNAKVRDLKMQKDAMNAKGSAATAEEKKALKQKMMNQKSDFEMKMKGVLTADQYKKWMGMREEGMEKAKTHKKAMQKESEMK